MFEHEVKIDAESVNGWSMFKLAAGLCGGVVVVSLGALAVVVVAALVADGVE